MTGSKQRIDSMDIMKFIASVLIVSMHAKALSDFAAPSMALEILARWGVPFFFSCSSFLLFRKSVNGNIDKSAVSRYSLRILKLYLVWFIINLPNGFIARLYSKDLRSITTYLTFIKDSLLSSTFTGSWYLLSSIFGAWVVYLLSKKLKTGAVAAITFIPFCLCALTSVYARILPESAVKAAEFLCFPLNIFNGCFYFALGKLMAEKADVIKSKISSALAAVMLIVFYAVFAAEVLICKKFDILSGTDVGFSLPVIAFLLMILCLKSNITTEKSLLLRKLSTIIFCCQGNALTARALMIRVLHIESNLLLYAAVVIMVSVMCVTVLFLQNHTNWKWCRYLT